MKEITELQVNSMLAGFLYQDLLEASKPDEAAVKAYYDTHKAEYDEAKVFHILVRFKGSRVPLQKDQKDLTPEEALAKAQDLKKKLDGGADFAELAKTESDDKASGATGAGICDRRVLFAGGPGERAGENPLRLSPHQSDRKAHEDARR